MAERRMANIVCEANRLGQRFVQREVSRNRSPDLGHLESVGQTGDVVIALWIDEYLGFVFQSAKRFGMQNTISVALESCSIRVEGLVQRTAPRLT